MRSILEEMLGQAPPLEVLNHAFASECLVNSAHCDDDSAMSMAIFLHDAACKTRYRPGALVFPTYGIAIILRHGTTIAWPGWVPHCTTAGGTAADPRIVPMLSLFASRSKVLDKTYTTGKRKRTAVYTVKGTSPRDVRVWVRNTAAAHAANERLCGKYSLCGALFGVLGLKRLSPSPHCLSSLRGCILCAVGRLWPHPSHHNTLTGGKRQKTNSS